MAFQTTLLRLLESGEYRVVGDNEIRKANRFGRTFSVVRIEFDGIPALRNGMPQAEFERWLEAITYQVGRSLRATDLLAAESDSRFLVLLPETDSLGATVLKRRICSGLAPFCRSHKQASMPVLPAPTIT